MRIEYRACQRDADRKVYHILKNELRLSARQIKRLKYAGAVFVDGESVFMDRRVRPGELVWAELSAAEPSPDFPPETGELDIIFENEALLAVNKPSGILTHPSRGKFTGTLANFASGYMLGTYGTPAIHCVNRLDRDTSGVILFAKSAHYKNLAIESLSRPESEKVYHAYLAGVLPEAGGVIDLPIDRQCQGCQKRVVRDTGKRAVTVYETLGVSTARIAAVSEVRLVLKTGRTHQIRVHCSHLGAPVLGDRLYANEASAALSEELGIGATLLHASSLTLDDPLTGRSLTLNAPENRPDMTKIGQFFRN